MRLGLYHDNVVLLCLLCTTNIIISLCSQYDIKGPSSHIMLFISVYFSIFMSWIRVK